LVFPSRRGCSPSDKAYGTDAVRVDLKRRGIKPFIPPKSNRTATIRYSNRLYRERNCIERAIGHLKINRAVATRYDQLANRFLDMLYTLPPRVIGSNLSTRPSINMDFSAPRRWRRGVRAIRGRVICINQIR
jgi:hypothetical protein